MAKPTGSHSAKPKGDNGTVDPKASRQTTEMTEGPYKGHSSGDNSTDTIVSRA
jgi:hypothetical protein